MEHGPPALGIWSLSHWTTRELPEQGFLMCGPLKGLRILGICELRWEKLYFCLHKHLIEIYYFLQLLNVHKKLY